MKTKNETKKETKNKTLDTAFSQVDGAALAQLKKCLDKQDSKNMIEFISKLRIETLIVQEDLINKLSKSFSKELDFQSDILNHLTTRINNYHKKNITDSADFIIFQAKLAAAKAELKKKLTDGEKDASLRLKNLEAIVEDYELANKLAVQNAKKMPADLALKLQKQANEGLVQLVEKHPINTESFAVITERVLKPRKEYSTENKFNMLKAYLLAAEIGYKINDQGIKVVALENAKNAYNIAVEVHKSPEATKAIKLQSDLWKMLGDNKKSALISSQITDEAIAATKKAEFTFLGIKKQGVDTVETVDIKQKIQSKILNPIMEAAAKGKWHDMQIGGIKDVATGHFIKQYGVQGYLGAELEKRLGKDITPEAKEIATMLCFEAINIGIMSAAEYNPTCAILFAQEYPDLLKKILAEHPEYFVSSQIMQATIKSVEAYAELVVEKIEPNPLSHNVYLEKQLFKHIENRITDSVLKPIADIIKAGTWSDSVQTTLLNYLTEDNLTKGITVNGYLGKNLGSINDGTNIARILAFREIIKAVESLKNANNAPIKAFINAYPELVLRVTEFQPISLTEKTAKNYKAIAQQAIKDQEFQAELKYIEAKVVADTEDIINKSMNAEHQKMLNQELEVEAAGESAPTEEA